MVVLESEAEVRAFVPDYSAIQSLDAFALIVTSRGEEVDFVSRFFAPRAGVPEDPVTGSAHCTLIPYWANRLGKSKLSARQISNRSGELTCELRGDRVRIGGKVVEYMRGEISVRAASQPASRWSGTPPRCALRRRSTARYASTRAVR